METSGLTSDQASQDGEGSGCSSHLHLKGHLLPLRPPWTCVYILTVVLLARRSEWVTPLPGPHSSPRGWSRVQ